MMQKRILAVLLTAVMACALFGCAAKDGDTKAEEDASPKSGVSPQSGASYYFIGGNLVGSLENGVFVSAVDTERAYDDERRYHKYTLKELFSHGYIYFDRDRACGKANEAAVYTGEGPGGFGEDMSASFAPYASRTMQDGPFAVLSLPCELTGELAATYAPEYGFYVNIYKDIDDLSYYPALATNYEDARLPDALSWDNGYSRRDEREIERTLSYAGISYGEADILTVSGDFDSDQRTESVIFANTAVDAEGFLKLDASRDEAPFGLILFCDDNEEYETVYLRTGEPLSDVTEHFRILPVGIFDLDGDGDFEIAAASHEWEWGSTFVLSRNDAGAWDIVMTAEWGT
ncbi:MAG: hypothetical protein IJG50_01465 [Clostridia bacterium]|nr:hypothetical protein [Clostridia bacterium]